MHGSHFRQRDVLSLPAISVETPRLCSDRRLDLRTVPEESPIALVYDGTTAAVVMATPADLTDFAIGFSLTEGIIKDAREIDAVDIVPGCQGIELRMWLTARGGRQFKKRQRRLVGPTGCGLCGIESLKEATRPFARLSREITLRSHQIERGMDALSRAQTLNHATHATHAAGFFLPDDTLVATREDVGRHNALDKLAGALAAERISGQSGAIFITSRNLDRIGAEGRGDRMSDSACDIGAHRAGRQGGRSIWHYIGGCCSRIFIRDLQPSRRNRGLSAVAILKGA